MRTSIGFSVRFDKRVHADDQFSLCVDISLIGERGVGDLAAEKASFDGGDHAAAGFDAVKDRQSIVFASRASEPRQNSCRRAGPTVLVTPVSYASTC